MKISLENYLRNKIDEVESMHSYELSTDTIRCWIDEYNEQLRLSDVVGQNEQLCECYDSHESNEVEIVEICCRCKKPTT